MKIVVTGSLGHISKPLATTLVQQGHQVTVISSKPDKSSLIERLDAVPSIGSLLDADFLTRAFANADAVYAMTPPNYSGVTDIRAYYRQIGNNYAHAIRGAGVSRVVFLSSMGANLDKGTGVVLGVHDVEQILNGLPGVALTHLRPGYFYYNLYNYTGMIKGIGSIIDNFGGDDRLVMAAPADIAAAAVDELVLTGDVKRIRYIASDEHTCSEIAHRIGAAIGMPGLQWNICTDAQSLEGLVSHGVPAAFAAGLVEMNACLHSGVFYSDYQAQGVLPSGRVKLDDFVKEFAVAFKAPQHG